MQRGRTALDSFPPETIDLNEGSFPNNTTMDGSWDNMMNPVENRLSNYMLPPNDDNGTFTNGAHNFAQRFWDRGESSSTANNLQERDSKMNLGWSSSFDACSGSDPRPEDCSFEPFNTSGPSYAGNHMTNRSLGMQNYSSNPSLPNMIANHGHVRDNDHHIAVGSGEPYTLFKSGHSESELFPTVYTSSSNRGNSSGSSSTYFENNDSSGPSFGTWGSSCKRKALEGTSGQFYGGSSSSDQPADNIMQHPTPGCYSTPRNLSVSSGPLNFSPTNHSEQLNSRSGVGMSRAAPSFFPSSSVPGITEGSARNFTLRSNLGHHDSVPFDTARGSVRHSGVYAAQQMSRPISNIGSSEFRPTMTMPMNSNQPQIMHVNEARSMHSYPYNGSFGSRGGGSSSSFMVSGERDTGVFDEVNFRRSPRNNLEYPMTVSAPETRNVRHDQIDWSFTPGTSSLSSRNHSSGSRISPPSGGRASSASLLPHQYQPSQNHQISESSSWIPYQRPESNSGTRRSHFALFPSGSSSSDAAANTSRSRHHSDPRSAALLMDMPGDDINSWRALAAVEGRHRLIRHVLSAMRRGVNLQAEDYVLIDPFINGFAELHDRHRDMRLDVDNMSYEELLALEERIGNVNTGLSEEKIRGSMEQRRYEGKGASPNLEPCCICQEEYISGDDIGLLDCGHEFHNSCIKQWLILKNLCPICKMTALNT